MTCAQPALFVAQMALSHVASEAVFGSRVTWRKRYFRAAGTEFPARAWLKIQARDAFPTQAKESGHRILRDQSGFWCSLIRQQT